MRIGFFRLSTFIMAAALACAGELEQGASKTSAVHADGARRLLAIQPEVASTLTGAGTLASDMAVALDISASMVISAQLTSPHPDAALVLRNWGVITPRKGASMVVLSTGRVWASALPEPGTDFPPLGPEGDVVSLRLTVNVPAGANRLSFRYNFLTAEFPEFLGSEFNESLLVRVTDVTGSRLLRVASVNESRFFDASFTRAGGTGFDLLLADDPSGVDAFPGDFPVGTRLFPDAGLTDFQTACVDISSGGQVTLEFEIRDVGDGLMDSAVVIDNIQFLALEAVDPNPNLLSLPGGRVVEDPEMLAVRGSPVDALAADGVTQLLLRMKVPGPGSVQFSLPSGDGLSAGSISRMDASSWSDSALSRVTATGTGAYYAFALYKAPEDFSTDPSGPFAGAKSRPVSITAQYLAPDRTGFVSELSLQVVRPPVVIVPAIWSSCHLWRARGDLVVDARFDVSCADDASVSSDGLESTRSRRVVPDAVYSALARLRENGTAVTQVDIVAHGTGGLLARKFVEGSMYRGGHNFNQGSMNRLITLNTPHLGARVADEIAVVRAHLLTMDPSGWLRLKQRLESMGIFIDSGTALDDLQTKGAFINGIGATNVPSHAMVSRGGKVLSYEAALATLMPEQRTLYMSLQLVHPANPRPRGPWHELFFGPESWTFCGQENDLFVAEVDQRGGLSGDAGSTQAQPLSIFNLVGGQMETGHFGIPADPEHHRRIIELLNRSVQSAWFAPSLPSPHSVPREDCRPRFLREAASAR